MDGIASMTPIVTKPTAPAKVKKSARPAASYRGARRNAVRAAGNLSEWGRSCQMVSAANEKANLAGRANQANGARESAAKAMVDARTRPDGLPGHITYATAMLEFYRGEKRTRPVNRIIRDLEKQVRA